jgi:hypothetical protein
MEMNVVLPEKLGKDQGIPGWVYEYSEDMILDRTSGVA